MWVLLKIIFSRVIPFYKFALRNVCREILTHLMLPVLRAFRWKWHIAIGVEDTHCLDNYFAGLRVSTIWPNYRRKSTVFERHSLSQCIIWTNSRRESIILLHIWWVYTIWVHTYRNLKIPTIRGHKLPVYIAMIISWRLNNIVELSVHVSHVKRPLFLHQNLLVGFKRNSGSLVFSQDGNLTVVWKPLLALT